jgi:glycosyltransferase involved in cell wall biosynthesis
MKLKILIDGHMIGLHEGGNERYTYNLAYHLSRIADVGVVMYKKLSINVKSHIFFLNDFLRLLYLPFFMKMKQYTLLHSNYILPFIKFPGTKYVITVHDLSFKRFPHLFSFKDRCIFSILFPYSLYLADAIVVPSQFTNSELRYFFPHINHKIIVTHEGVDPVFHILPAQQKKQRYVICVTSKSKRKNIDSVIESFTRAKFAGIKLVVVGIVAPLIKINPSVEYLEYVSDKKLNYLYNNALALIYYSSYEGFGLPIIEALSLNIPVIASDIPCHREIGKTFPHYVPVNNTAKLTQTIKKIVETKKRTIVRQKILKMYNWDVTASKTLAFYKTLSEI